MTNREYMAQLLTDPYWFDDDGALYEEMVHYNIDCPYFCGDERRHCGEDKEPNRKLCVECKMEWLEAEVDE